MARDFFRMVPAGASMVSGTLISDVQSALAASGMLAGSVDGLYGRGTRDALSAFQASQGLPASGTVCDTTWPALMRTAAPPIFERCLQVTASFEGTGFTRVVGNFDGAGITWGIIGFTLSNGELGSVLATLNERQPAAIAATFGHDADEVLRICGPATTQAQKLAWADSVSRGPQKFDVAEPWRTRFSDLGSRPEVQKIQIDRARDKYWSIATRDAATLGLSEELDMLLLFDIAVQNGGMGSKGRAQAARDRFAADRPADAQARRRIVAQVVADTIGGQFKHDVLTRKMTIANGGGTVHGGKYTLQDWGFLDGAVPPAG